MSPGAADVVAAGQLGMWERQTSYIDGARRFRHDGLVIFLTGLSDPALDTVLVESEPADPMAALDAAIALCEVHGSRFALETEVGRYPQLERALEQRGARVTLTKPAFALALDAEPRDAADRTPADPADVEIVPSTDVEIVPSTDVEIVPSTDVEIVTVTDPDDLQHAWALDVAAFGFSASTAARYLPPAALATPGRALLLGRIDDEVVSMASVHLDGGALGIFGVATSRRARRRGIGAAITRAAVEHGRAHGARWAWLHATPMAERLYRSLGFRHVNDWQVWTV